MGFIWLHRTGVSIVKCASPAHSVLLAQPEELCNLDLDAHFQADYVHKTLKCHFKLFNVNLTSCVYSALVSAIYVLESQGFFSFYVLQLLYFGTSLAFYFSYA